MPGVVYIDHGARYDPIVLGKLDRGGAINTITPHKGASKNCHGAMVENGFLVDIDRTNLDELRKEYPEVFKQPYDHTAGLHFDRVLGNTQ